MIMMITREHSALTSLEVWNILEEIGLCKREAKTNQAEEQTQENVTVKTDENLMIGQENEI